MTLILVVNVFAGCKKSQEESMASASETSMESSSSSESESTASQKTAASTGPVSIKIFDNSPEYEAAMKACIAEYKKIKPNVTVNLETVWVDYLIKLKAKLNSGDIPDVFTTSAGSEIKTYEKYSEDLTKEPFVKSLKDDVKKIMSDEDKVYGFPMKINAFGMLYNKEIFENNKITVPKTLIELGTACEKLKAAGIQPFTTGYKEWPVFKNMLMHFFDAAQPNDTQGLVKKFTEGKAKLADYPIINDNWFNFVDMTVKYGDEKPLETDRNAEIAAFAGGKAAMLLGQGSWVEAEITKINPKLKIGFTGYPTSGNPAESLLVTGADQAVRIYKDSKVKKDALELYNWLYTSDYGAKWFEETAKVIPPIKDAPIPNTQIGNEVKNYLSSNKAGELSINYATDDFHMKLGEIMQGYIARTYDKEKAVKEVETAWQKLGKAK